LAHQFGLSLGQVCGKIGRLIGCGQLNRRRY
jgi:hypothetical protein